MMSKKGVLETHHLLIDFRCQHGSPEMLKKILLHYKCCNLRDLSGQENWLKMKTQMAPKRHQDWSLWRPRSDLLRFELLLSSLLFDVFWCWQKTAQRKQNKNWREVGPPGTAGGANHNPGWLLKLSFWPDSVVLCLTTPDTGRFRQILAPTGFWRGPKVDRFLIIST